MCVRSTVASTTVSWYVGIFSFGKPVVYVWVTNDRIVHDLQQSERPHPPGNRA